jgi:hypothetical protein
MTTGEAMKPKFADRFIDSIEFLAALFVGIVAADVFRLGAVALFFRRLDSGQL